MSTQKTSEIEVAWLSDVGQKRPTNQDACGEFKREDGTRLLVLADGMGGHSGGEIASQIALEAIGKSFVESLDEPPDYLLPRAFHEANRRVRARAAAEPELAGMGTTGVALWMDASERIWVAHVGDSRAYRLRDGTLHILTSDHSVVGEMLRRGMLSQSEADVHPRRNELMRSIGSTDSLELDLAQVDARPNDRFLLCSDGLYCAVEHGEIADILGRETAWDAVRALVDLANARGGPDNISVQVAAFPPGPIHIDELRASASTGRPRTWLTLGIGVALTVAAALGWLLLRP